MVISDLERGRSEVMVSRVLVEGKQAILASSLLAASIPAASATAASASSSAHSSHQDRRRHASPSKTLASLLSSPLSGLLSFVQRWEPNLLSSVRRWLRVQQQSEKDAQVCLYDASWDAHFCFCCDIDEEISSQLASLPGVVTKAQIVDHYAQILTKVIGNGCNLLSQCFNSYEYCVSCCLNPALTSKEQVLKTKIAKPATTNFEDLV